MNLPGGHHHTLGWPEGAKEMRLWTGVGSEIQFLSSDSRLVTKLGASSSPGLCHPEAPSNGTSAPSQAVPVVVSAPSFNRGPPEG